MQGKHFSYLDLNFWGKSWFCILFERFSLKTSLKSFYILCLFKTFLMNWNFNYAAGSIWVSFHSYFKVNPILIGLVFVYITWGEWGWFKPWLIWEYEYISLHSIFLYGKETTFNGQCNQFLIRNNILVEEICISIYLSIHLPLISIYLSVYLSILLSSICLSVYLSTSPSD